MMKRVTIEFVAPRTYQVVLSGASQDQDMSIEIAPLTVGELPAVVEIVGSLFSLLSGIPGGAAALEEDASDEDRAAVAMYMIDAMRDPSRSTDLLLLLSMLIRCDLAWVRGLAHYQAAHLLIHAITVNMDFFTRSMPAVMAALRAMRPTASTPTGLTHSSS